MEPSQNPHIRLLTADIVNLINSAEKAQAHVCWEHLWNEHAERAEPRIGLMCQLSVPGQEVPCFCFVSKGCKAHENYASVRILFPEQKSLEPIRVPSHFLRKFEYNSHVDNLQLLAPHIIWFLKKLLDASTRSKSKATTAVLVDLADAIINCQLQAMVDCIASKNREEAKSLLRCVKLAKARCLMLRRKMPELYAYATKVCIFINSTIAGVH